MTKRKWMVLLALACAAVLLPWGIERASGSPGGAPAAAGPGGGTYYANSPSGGASGTALRKFVDSLPGLGSANANNLGQYIPIAVADTLSFPGSDFYRIGLVDFTERLHSDLPKATKIRGYKDLNSAAPAHHLGPLIIAQRNRAVRLLFTNMLGAGAAGNLFLPVDTTAMGAGPGPSGGNFTQNRAVIHLHGGFTPWISDGTAHQWITPAAEPSIYKTGMSQQNVPDMATPVGSSSHYYPNQQSGRLMFYHDHAYGITRLNVYAGEVAGYLLQDPNELALVSSQVIPNVQIPLIIQDKTFVPADIAVQDALWDTASWGAPGDFWFPHVYEPNQNPDSSINPKGRWDYGPWVWPPAATVNPVLPHPSLVPEGFMDTPLVNGTAYPFLNVEPRRYRFRVLNGCNDRWMNLQLYYADATGTEVAMVPANGLSYATPTNGTVFVPFDGRAGGVPDPTKAGPAFIQIGSEGGLLPAPVVLNAPPNPVDFDYDRRSMTFGLVRNYPLPPNYPNVGYTLLLGPAERADIIVDFSGIAAGTRLILYNDAPTPNPGFDPRYDYYTGNPDLTANGGAPSTLAGYGPNTRTIMQFRVIAPTGTLPADPYTFATNLPLLQGQLPTTFAASQPAPLVPAGIYADNTSVSLNGLPVHYKSIAEDFEPIYGRMNAKLGTEIPSLNSQGQQTFGWGYSDPATEVIPEGETQIWSIVHNGVDTHAIHFHLFNVQVINRVDWAGVIKPPDPNELGWKETVKMNPLENCIVALRPSKPALPFMAAVPDSVRPNDVTSPVTATNPMVNFGWEYVWHCHMLGHEENDMMRPLVMITAATAVPNANPTGLTATPVAGPQINLSWAYTAGTSVPSGMRIERAVGAGAFATLVLMPPNALLYTDTTVHPATQYSYRVFAYNSIGDSLPSNTAVVTTGDPAGPPAAPTSCAAVTAPPPIPATVRVTWTPTGTLESGFRIERSSGGSAFAPAGSVGAGIATFDDTGLLPATMYTYRVIAFNALGDSPASNTAVVTTLAYGRDDFNADGQEDLLWRNFSTGENYTWYLSHSVPAAAGAIGARTTAPSPAMAAPPMTTRAIQLSGTFDGTKAESYQSPREGLPESPVQSLRPAEMFWAKLPAPQVSSPGQGLLNALTLTKIGGDYLTTVTDMNWKPVGTADFNRDGKIDLLWRNTMSGENYVWYLNGVTKIGGAYIASVTDQNWEIAGTGDFNGDGMVDLLWRHKVTGELDTWYLNNVTRIGGQAPPAVPDLNWQIQGTGDFNADGRVDILWRNVVSGENYVWYMSGVTKTGGAYLTTITDFNWIMQGTGDFNGDGKPDIIWRNYKTGEIYVWYLNGVAQMGGDSLPVITDFNWKIINH